MNADSRELVAGSWKLVAELGSLSSADNGWHNFRMSIDTVCVTGGLRSQARSLARTVAICCGLAVLNNPLAQAQDAANQAPAPPTQDNNRTIRFRLPTVTVTAQKEPEDVQEVPLSVTAVTSETLEA